MVTARPQPFFMNLAAPLAQHKLAFLTQVCWPIMLGHKLAYPVALHTATVERRGCVTSLSCHDKQTSPTTAACCPTLPGCWRARGARIEQISSGLPQVRHHSAGRSLLPPGRARRTYAIESLPALLRRMRPHDSPRRLPADDDAAVEYIEEWLAAWPETDSGRQWAQAPHATSDT